MPLASLSCMIFDLIASRALRSKVGDLLTQVSIATSPSDMKTTHLTSMCFSNDKK
jgi:hypothetical protein